MNRSKVGSTDQKLYQQFKSWINKSKVGLTDQKLVQQIKSLIDRSNLDELEWTDQKLNEQIQYNCTLDEI